MIICHVTSAHTRYDIRIFTKMCTSLAQEGIETSLVVADGNGNEFVKNVNISDAGAKQGGRLSRMTKVVYKVYKKALELKADIYHLHDPELMFVGLLLKSKGYKVIFDAHEDLPKQLSSKPYLNVIMRVILPRLFSLIEHVCFKYYDGLIGATPKITEKLTKINQTAQTVNNYPIFGELTGKEMSLRNTDVCYLGGISEIRGIRQMVTCLNYLEQTNLMLAGSFNSDTLRKQIETEPGWSKVKELGQVDRKQAAEVLSTSLAGLVLFHAVPNHIEAQPNKLFEYMSAGLPVISSNFEMWKDIIEVNNCGLCVDPMNPKEIAEAILYLILNPTEAKKMGENGYGAVKNKYNWEQEKQKLISFYSKVLEL